MHVLVGMIMAMAVIIAMWGLRVIMPMVVVSALMLMLMLMLVVSVRTLVVMLIAVIVPGMLVMAMPLAMAVGRQVGVPSLGARDPLELVGMGRRRFCVQVFVLVGVEMDVHVLVAVGPVDVPVSVEE